MFHVPLLPLDDSRGKQERTKRKKERKVSDIGTIYDVFQF